MVSNSFSWPEELPDYPYKLLLAVKDDTDAMKKVFEFDRNIVRWSAPKLSEDKTKHYRYAHEHTEQSSNEGLRIKTYSTRHLLYTNGDDKKILKAWDLVLVVYIPSSKEYGILVRKKNDTACTRRLWLGAEGIGEHRVILVRDRAGPNCKRVTNVDVGTEEDIDLGEVLAGLGKGADNSNDDSNYEGKPRQEVYIRPK